MKLYLLYILILLFNFLIFKIIRNNKQSFKVVGIISIISSFVLILIWLIFRYIIIYNFSYINIKFIIDYYFKKMLISSLFLFILGNINLIISLYLKKYSK